MAETVKEGTICKRGYKVKRGMKLEKRILSVKEDINWNEGRNHKKEDIIWKR